MDNERGKTFPDAFDDISPIEPRGADAIWKGHVDFWKRHKDETGYAGISRKALKVAYNTSYGQVVVEEVVGNAADVASKPVAIAGAAVALAGCTTSPGETITPTRIVQTVEGGNISDFVDGEVHPTLFSNADLVGASVESYDPGANALDARFGAWAETTRNGETVSIGDVVTEDTVQRINVGNGTFYTINVNSGDNHLLMFAIPQENSPTFDTAIPQSQPLSAGTVLASAEGGALTLTRDSLLLYSTHGDGDPGRGLLLVPTDVDPQTDLEAEFDPNATYFEPHVCSIQGTGEKSGIVTCAPINSPLWVATPGSGYKPTRSLSKVDTGVVESPLPIDTSVPAIPLTATPPSTAAAEATATGSSGGSGGSGGPSPETPTPTPTVAATEAPTQTPTVEAINSDSIVEMMVQAEIDGEETIQIESPSGTQVSIDIVPAEVRVQGEWSWAYRGFTRQIENSVQVYRTLQGVGENDSGQWFTVMSEMNLPGSGLVTIEYDPTRMAELYGFSDIHAVNPDKWQVVLDAIWGQLTEREVAEKLNHITSSDIAQNGLQDVSIYRTDIAEKEAGLSIILDHEFRGTMYVAESWNGEPSYAFDGTVDGGRTQLDIFISHWEAPTFDDADLADYNIAYVTLTTVDWLLHQSNGAGVIPGLVDFARSDMNPWKEYQGTTFPLPKRNSEILESVGYKSDDIFSTNNIGSFVARN